MAMLDQITAPRVPTAASALETSATGVVTFDDVLDDAARKRIFDYLRGTGWSFGWKSNGANDQFSFWHRHFAGTRGQKHEEEVGKAPDCAEELRRKSGESYQPAEIRSSYAWFLSPSPNAEQ